ncbi:hypothetical protein LINPERHAP1_LOCUS21059 [Linum perenne]
MEPGSNSKDSTALRSSTALCT